MKLSQTLFLALCLCLNSCVPILKAHFNSDTIGGEPNKILPGSPSGDELTYIPAIENRLKIVSWEGSNSLEITNVAPTGSPSAHTTGTTFKSRNTTLSSSVSYTWNGQVNSSGFGSDLIMDLGDGMGTPMVRLMLSNSGALTYTTDFINKLPIGTVTPDQKHNFIVTCNISTKKFNIRISQSGGVITKNDLSFVPSGDPIATNARPTISFNYGQNQNPQQKYNLDDLIISRPRRSGD